MAERPVDGPEKVRKKDVIMPACNRRAFLGGAVSVLGSASGAWAQAFSSSPVTVVVPFSAGSGADTLARQFTHFLGARRGQAAIVENRVGASGNIGTNAVVRAAPDGGIVLLTANTLVSNVSLYKSIRYNPATDLAPIVALASTDYALVVHDSVLARSAPELVELARRRPGELNFGSPGVGTPHHLGLELLRQSASVDLKHVPYSALSGATKDVAGGHIAGMMLPAAQAVQLAATGDVRLLAFTGRERSAAAPEVPTFAEVGLPEVDIASWWGLFAPARTGAPIIDWYSRTGNEFLADGDTRRQLAAQALQPIGGPPDRLKEMVERDLVKWERVIRQAKLSLE